MIDTQAAQPGFWSATAMIAAVVLCSTAGEVLTAAAMKSIGDLDDIRSEPRAQASVSWSRFPRLKLKSI